MTEDSAIDNEILLAFKYYNGIQMKTFEYKNEVKKQMYESKLRFTVNDESKLPDCE